MSLLVTTRRPARFKPVVSTPLNWSHPACAGLVGAWLGTEQCGNIVRNWAKPGRLDLNIPIATARINWNTQIGNLTSAPMVGSVWNPSAQLSLAADTLIDGLITTGGTQGFTWLGWFKNSGSATFWQKFTSGGANMWGVGSNATDLEFNMSSTNGGRFTPLSTGIPADHSSRIHCYVITYNGVDWKTLANFQMWCDGVPLTMSSSQNNPVTLNSDSVAGGIWKVQGMFSHVMIWNRVLSGDEIIELYVDPFCFTMPNQRSILYQVQGLTPPFVKRGSFYVVQ